MKTVYRISDNGYVKPKLPGATKLLCLENFLETFGKIDYLIADNCSNETIEKISTVAEQFHVTKLGNAPSFIYSVDILAKEGIENDELIYFVEDDYLHHPNSKSTLENALNLADYLTLFDHPDKYSRMYSCGETSKVQRVKNQHWKTSVSTTMTFACKYKTIKDDFFRVFKKSCVNFHPNDHEIFERLQKTYKRKLMVCIPGLSFHTDVTTYIMNVDSLSESMDSWAVDYIIEKMKVLIFKTNDGDLVEELEVLIRTKNRDYSVSNNLAYLENLSTIYEKRKLK
jgi:hypothetical protein